MILTEPQVTLLTTTAFDETLIERAGCVCYNSAPGEPGRRIPMWVASGHLSVIEHGRASFQVYMGHETEEYVEAFLVNHPYLRATYNEDMSGAVVTGNYRTWLEVFRENAHFMAHDMWEELVKVAPHTFAQAEPSNDAGHFDVSLVEPTAEFFDTWQRGSFPSHAMVHCAASFEIECSRVVTHELVRHRPVSYSQRSQRYVKEDEQRYFLPPEVSEIPISGSWASQGIAEHELTTADAYRCAMNQAWATYALLRKAGLPPQIARYTLPNACLTRIVVTANLEQLHHMLDLRISHRAQPETQMVAGKMLDLLLVPFPAQFVDLKERLV